MEYFVQKLIFSSKQFGFLKGRSTVSLLLQISDDWSAKLELGGRIDVILQILTMLLIRSHAEDC